MSGFQAPGRCARLLHCPGTPPDGLHLSGELASFSAASLGDREREGRRCLQVGAAPDLQKEFATRHRRRQTSSSLPKLYVYGAGGGDGSGEPYLTLHAWNLSLVRNKSGGSDLSEWREGATYPKEGMRRLCTQVNPAHHRSLPPLHPLLPKRPVSVRRGQCVRFIRPCPSMAPMTDDDPNGVLRFVKACTQYPPEQGGVDRDLDTTTTARGRCYLRRQRHPAH